MNKNLLTISLRWGILIGFFQILSHYLLVYILANVSINIKNSVEILTILISFYFIYRSIRDYKRTFDPSKPLSILKAFYAGACPSIFFIVLFALYFIILIHVVDPSFLNHYALISKDVKDVGGKGILQNIQSLTPWVYVIKYINHYLLFQLTAALFLAVFMQRKIEEPHPQDDNNENN